MIGAAAECRSEVVPMVELPGGQRRGLGELRIAGEARRILPLSGVSIRARVTDRVAEVEVEQRFQNPFAEALEATYIFPLDGGAAVSRFELQVGARVLRGKVEERGEARRQYQQALDQGKRAALLEQERDDVFTIQVGNLPAGDEVIVRLVYSEKLPCFDDGTTELRLPLVVAPRYIAGQPIETPENAGRGTEDDTDQVPDASRITPPRLAPGFDARVSLRLSVDLLHGQGFAGLASLACSQHATRLAISPEVMNVSLAGDHEPLDRDFVLRWRIASEVLASTVLVHRMPEGEGFGLFSIVPPRRDDAVAARDVVFVVDRSGSMEGQKIASAARACSMLLHTLGPRDRFAIQAFDNAVEWMDGAPRLVPADEAGLAKGDKWLRGIGARGGTEIEPALVQALGAIAASRDEPGRVPVIVLLTDGEIGAEGRVLARVQREAGATRIFTVGIDTAVNSGFLKKLAQLGRGTATFVEPGAALEDALRAVAREVGQPLVMDLSVEDVDARLIAPSGAPERMPDLFVGRAASCSFRFAPRAASGAGSIRVRGRFADGSPFEQVVAVREVAMPGLAHVWARARVADLEDRFRTEPGRQAELRQEIIALALRHTLLTRFTAFVVVDDSEIVNRTGARREVTQPVEMPAGWAELSAQATLAPPSFARPTAPPAAALSPASASMADLSSGAGARGGPTGPMARFAAAARSKKSSAGKLDAHGGKEAALDDDAGAEEQSRGASLDELSKLVQRKGAFEPSPSLAPPPPPRPVSGPVPDERRAVRAAFDELAQALGEVRRELLAGRAPSAAALEQARRKLLALLAAQPVSQKLPALERYVRTTLYLLISALGGAGAAAARQLLEQQGPELEAAAREVDALAGPSSRGRFWEASI